MGEIGRGESAGKHAGPPEWFARHDGPEGGAGLRFGCTQCGNCCSGPPGFVLVSEAECVALARRLGLSIGEFKARHTHTMERGRSLNEVAGPRGFDCVFLDRTSVPGRAVCGVYEDRPGQCRTWPFWGAVVRTPQTWAAAGRSCPGINKGELVSVQQVRVLRDAVAMEG
jgi:hypothetical protein